jgi:hypothetical protein
VVQVQLVLVKVLEDLPNHVAMFMQCFGVDEDVVEVYANDTFCNHVLEDFIHHLSGRWQGCSLV